MSPSIDVSDPPGGSTKLQPGDLKMRDWSLALRVVHDSHGASPVHLTDLTYVSSQLNDAVSVAFAATQAPEYANWAHVIYPGPSAPGRCRLRLLYAGYRSPLELVAGIPTAIVAAYGGIKYVLPTPIDLLERVYHLPAQLRTDDDA